MSALSAKKVVVAVLSALLIIAGGFRVTTLASAASRPVRKNYYSVMIRNGDTLWSIAEQCCSSSRAGDIRKTVSELKQMKHSSDEESLRAGAYLMVYQIVQ